MRKFTTSLFIALLALLALPEKAWAWTSVEFRSSLDNWAEGKTMTKKSENSFSYEVTASENFEFKFFVSDGNLWLGSYNTSSNTVSNYDGTTEYWCSNKGTNNFTFNVDSKYTKYKIDLTFGNTGDDGNQYFKFTVTGVTEGGSSAPVSYALVGESTNWTWNDSYVFTNTAENTYSLDIAGSTFSGKSFKLMYKKGSTDGWAAGPATDHLTITLGEAVSFNGDGGKNYVFPTLENKDYVIELTTNSKTAGSFTVKEKTSAPETKYTVTVSSADETMGTVSTSSVSVNATTGATVTATPNTTDYEFFRWTASTGVTVDDEFSAKTTVKATQAGTLTANFKAATSTPTKNIPGFYLVGDFLNTDNSINYNCRYFKLSEGVAAAARESVEQYSINIPTTLAVNVQVLAINEDGSTALYGPSGTLAINKTNPKGSGTITGDLVEADKTLTNYFKFEDRTTGRTEENPDANDGLYTITITVTNGVPTNYTIKHNPLTRVAYYLPNTPDASVKESLNSRDQETGSFNNVFFGRVYLPAGVACYVLSNYLGNYDSNKKTDTKTKLYLQGNKSGGNPDTNADGAEKDKYTKVYPITRDDGSRTDAKAFTFSETEIVAMNLEYAPRRGKNDDGYKAEDITGEVIRSQKGTQAEDGTSITVPTIKVLKMVGPAVGDETWDYSKGVVMDYNMAEQCWEATINTTAAAGAKFRFVANDTWGNSWQENGTKDEDKAKIPYDDDTRPGHAATAADPNEVSYISTLTSADDKNNEYAIIFNRNPGKWRVRFYFTSKQIGTGDKYQYIFKYTINGYKSVLRTYCSDVDQKPKADSNIKVYGAYAFKGNEETKSGKIMLYEMNYIPAKHGVILYSTNTIDDATIETVMDSYTPTEGETKYINIPDDKYENYLVGTLLDTKVNASEFVGEQRTHRNFFFNYLSNTGYYEQGVTDDYLGFFRIKSGSTCYKNHAYLSLPTSVLAWNGQTFEEVMDKYPEAEKNNQTKGMRIIFSDGSDWEDNTTTGISVIPQTKPADDAYYTLQGVRVAAPTKGIYIHKGKKIIVK